jgi:hypothetical protein
LRLQTLLLLINLTVSNLTVNQAAQTVTFNLKWNNSWRVSTVPFNWDAAWIFVKFRTCGASPTIPWTHGLVSVNLADHNFGSDLEPTLSDGSAVGIDAAPNNTGVMLRRTAEGVYPNAGPHMITLKVTNLPTTGDIDVKVFAIEMVYIPQDSFYVNDTYWGFATQAITSESAVTLQTTRFMAVNDWYSVASASLNLPATYPKGYAPFYLMKYEISQDQYAQFLNTLPEPAHFNRFLGNFNTNRNRVNNTGTPPNIYVTDRPDRAQNFLGWNDLAAYLDWAALRPMSELEYVKACRGKGPVVPGEFPWGTTTIVEENVILGLENGTETGNTPNSNCNYNGTTTTISGGDGGSGPYRCGIFALPTSNRITAGAGFYGNMELAGNVYEIVVCASNNGGASFQRVWGDGNLSPTGFHDVVGWPGTSFNNNAVSIVGGAWTTNSDRCRVNDRYNTHYHAGYSSGGTYAFNRYDSVGGRGAR